MPAVETPFQLLARGFFGLAEMLAEPGSGQVTKPASVNLAPPFTNMSRENWLRALYLWQQTGKELLADQPERSCPACSHGESRFIFTSYDGYPFVDCLECGCWYVPKVVDGELFSRFFERCPEAKALAKLMTEDRLEASRTEYDQGHFGALIDELLPILEQGGEANRTLLDVGCGVGHGLKAGKARGLTAVGLEADPDCIALGHELGLDIRDRIPTGSFDIIALWETLEHVTAPAGLLQGLNASLAAGGILTVLVPNLNSPSVRVLRGDCSVVHGGMNGPGHINLFHAKGVKDLLKKTGFTILDIDGHFSDNPFELASHILGLSRGAYDMVFQGRDTLELPPSIVALLNGIWPAISEIERLSLTAPLLRVIACRSGEESRFSGSISKLRAKREEDIRAHLSQLKASCTNSAAFHAPFPSLQLQSPTWQALPPLKNWESSAEVRVVASDDSGIDVEGNDSAFGYQLVSPLIPVKQNRAITLLIPLFVIDGQLSVGVLDQNGEWLLPATSTSSTLKLATKEHERIRVVIANLQHDPAKCVRTRFRLQRGCIAIEQNHLSRACSSAVWEGR